jgi:hypothetical protein
LDDGLPLAQGDLGLMQLGNDVFDGVRDARHNGPPFDQTLTEDLDRFKGAGQFGTWFGLVFPKR